MMMTLQPCGAANVSSWMDESRRWGEYRDQRTYLAKANTTLRAALLCRPDKWDPRRWPRKNDKVRERRFTKMRTSWIYPSQKITPYKKAHW